MEQKMCRLPVMIATAALAVAGFFLRQHQLKTAFDAIGVIPGAGRTFSWITVAVVVLFAVYTWFLRSRKKYAAISSRWMPLFVVSCAAAALLLLGSILQLGAPVQKSALVIAAGGIVTAVCWVMTALSRYQAKAAHGALFLLPAVFYVVDLVLRFRLWTRDPVILDYCYDLLALICTMCALFHLGGFCFDQGRRRSAVFFTMGGVFFNVVAMAGAPAAEALSYLAATLWLLVNLWLLLRPVSRRTASAEEGE